MNARVGNKLRELRKSKGYSIGDLINKLNISESTYLRMEKGETNSWINKIDKICEIYQIEPEELILSDEKYTLINNNQEGGYTSSVIINNLSEKTIDLYERMLVEKDKRIAELEMQIKNQK